MNDIAPTLTTERLILRPLAASDISAYAALNADPEVARFLSPDGQPYSAHGSWHQLAMFIGHWTLRGFGMWAVAEAERPHVLVGRVGAYQPDGWPDIEIGWALARSCWGRGYATEGAAAAIRYAFDVLERPRIVSLIHPANARSLAVAARLGQRRSGEWVHREQSLELHALDHADWRAAQSVSPGS